MAASSASILKPFVFGIMVVGLPLSYLAYFAHVHFTDDPKSIWYHSTYADYLKALDFQPIDENTSEEVVGYVMLGKIYPHHKTNQKKLSNRLFVGSPEHTLKNIPFETKISNKTKKLTFLQSDTEQAKQLKLSCIGALNQNPYGNQKRADQLKEWCTVPTVSQLLQRHKFVLNSTEEDWKVVAESDWFKNNGSNKENQSFFEIDEEQKIFEAETNTEKKIEILEKRCRAELDKPLKRVFFPLNAKFLKSLTEVNGIEKKADKFQEAALFCTKPITAGHYVTEIMQGVIKSNLDDNYLKNIDYCFIANYTIEQYKNIKTTDPMDGKTFWCAVRLIYDRSKNTIPKEKPPKSLEQKGTNGVSTNDDTHRISTNEIQS